MSKSLPGTNPTALDGEVRLRKACDACSIAHCSCTGEHPRCKRCANRNAVCIYSPINSPFITTEGEFVSVKKSRKTSIPSDKRKSRPFDTSPAVRTDSSSSSNLSSPLSPLHIKSEDQLGYSSESPSTWTAPLSALGPLSAPVSPSKMTHFEDTVGPVRTMPRKSSIQRANRPSFVDLTVDSLQAGLPSPGLLTPGLSNALSSLFVADSPPLPPVDLQQQFVAAQLSQLQAAQMSHIAAYAPQVLGNNALDSQNFMHQQGLLLHSTTGQSTQSTQMQHAIRLKQNLVDLKVQQDKLESMKRAVEASLAQVEQSLPVSPNKTPSPSKSHSPAKIVDILDSTHLLPSHHGYREKSASTANTASPNNTTSAHSSVAGTPSQLHERTWDPFMTEAIGDIDLNDYSPMDQVLTIATVGGVPLLVRFPSDDSLDQYGLDT
jgi:hypothetical protein